jgi:hypothetical protein
MTADPTPIDQPDGLPPPPRPITARVRRRAWADPPVRLWWGAALALVLLGLYLCGQQVLSWRRQVWLVEHGTEVTATVKQANNELFRRKQPGDASVVLAFEWQGKPYQVSGILEGRNPRDQISVEDKVPIRIDPNDPDTWTARGDRPPLGVELVGGGILIGLAVLAVLPAVVLRGRVLRTWRDGPPARAVIVGRHQTALAPRARAVRCMLDEAGPPGEADAPAESDGGERRVMTVYAPASVAWGEELTVLVPPGGGRPLAVAWFE